MILILLIVLLVPLRLNVKARYDEEVRARVHVSWLLRAVHVKFEWLKDHGLVRAKLLGLKTLMKKHVGDWGPQPPEEEASSGKPEESEETAEGESVPAEPGDEPASSDAPASSEAAAASSGSAASAEDASSQGEEKPAAEEGKPSQEEEKPAPEEDKPSSAPKPDGKEEKKEEKAEGAPDGAGPAAEADGTEAEEDLPRLAGIEKKLDEIAGKLDEFRGYWYDEKNRKTVRLVGKQLKKIGRHMKPTHFLVEGELGFGDPAKTGKIMGTLYSFYPVFRDSVRISGNYEEKVVKLRLELKGRLRLGIFVEVAVRLLLDKNLRRWIKKLTHKDKDSEKTEEETAEAADREQKAA